MKSILLILLLNISSYNHDISTIRELYLAAYTSESNCNNFGEKLNSTRDTSSVLIKGYEGCFYFIKCKFINSPIHQLIYFNKGKELLDSAIIEDPTSVELKFLRYSMQKNLPGFLLYNDSIEKDLNFVNENMKSIEDKALQKFINNSLESLAK